MVRRLSGPAGVVLSRLRPRAPRSRLVGRADPAGGPVRARRGPGGAVDQDGEPRRLAGLRAEQVLRGPAPARRPGAAAVPDRRPRRGALPRRADVGPVPRQAADGPPAQPAAMTGRPAAGQEDAAVTWRAAGRGDKTARRGAGGSVATCSPHVAASYPGRLASWSSSHREESALIRPWTSREPTRLAGITRSNRSAASGMKARP